MGWISLRVGLKSGSVGITTNATKGFSLLIWGYQVSTMRNKNSSVQAASSSPITQLLMLNIDIAVTNF
jgi:hypothetical protein